MTPFIFPDLEMKNIPQRESFIRKECDDEVAKNQRNFLCEIYFHTEKKKMFPKYQTSYKIPDIVNLF